MLGVDILRDRSFRDYPLDRARGARAQRPDAFATARSVGGHSRGEVRDTARPGRRLDVRRDCRRSDGAADRARSPEGRRPGARARWPFRAHGHRGRAARAGSARPDRSGRGPAGRSRPPSSRRSGDCQPRLPRGPVRPAPGAARPAGRADARGVSPEPDRAFVRRARRRAVPRLQHGVGGGALAARRNRRAARARRHARGACRALFLAEAATFAVVGCSLGVVLGTPPRGRRGGADGDDRVGAVHRDRGGAAGTRLVSRGDGLRGRACRCR